MLVDTKYAGADWIKTSLRIENISPLGVEVADFLGDLYLGIYHMDTHSLKKVEWDNDYCIRVQLPVCRSLATFDGDMLTRIVVLSHDRMLRVDLETVNFHYMAMLIHKRHSRVGDTYHRMPTMESHVEAIRLCYAIKPFTPSDKEVKG